MLRIVWNRGISECLLSFNFVTILTMPPKYLDESKNW